MRRTLFYPTETIKGDRPGRDMPAIPETRKPHVGKPDPSAATAILKGSLSCFYEHCKNGNEESCIDMFYVGKWQKVAKEKKIKRETELGPEG